MRRIISKEEESKKKRRNHFLIGGILIFVMVMSSVGYAFTRDSTSNSGTEIDYNGYKFTQSGDYWNLAIGNAQFSFKYLPNQVMKTNSLLNPASNYANKPLYIYSENAAAASEIARNLVYQNQIAQRVQEACPSGENCSDNAPTKTCDDNFIIIKESNMTSISQDKNCVYIQGNSENLTAMSDSFLFKIIGVQ